VAGEALLLGFDVGPGPVFGLARITMLTGIADDRRLGFGEGQGGEGAVAQGFDGVFFGEPGRLNGRGTVPLQFAGAISYKDGSGGIGCGDAHVSPFGNF
jgi:hypothetical protein